MSRAARFEICRGDDGWWARFRAANGRVVFVSETYERRRGAERAILAIARAFWGGAEQAVLAEDEIGTLFAATGDDGCYVEVREVDER